MKKNVALFGLGRIGVMHAKNIVLNSKLKLKYVYDINQKIAKIYNGMFAGSESGRFGYYLTYQFCDYLYPHR